MGFRVKLHGNNLASLMSQMGHFRPSSAGLPVGPFRFAPRADIPPDGDSDLVAHDPAQEHGANREAIGELHFIGTTHHCGDGVWEAAARLY
ncbi:MAG: hypothetical protein WB689_34815 [Xanthobacteraceae bacterium]